MQLPLVAMVLREASALMRISSNIYKSFRAAVNMYVGVYIHVAAKNYEQARHTHTHAGQPQ